MVKKKIKSVERVKKKKVEEKPIIENIQVKQPLSNGSQNLNNQIVQVIFPADVEIRKVKKRKRKRTSKKDNEKEELLTELKEKLQQYDLLQEEAQKANIKIPSELGVSIISKSDLKTNDDIKTYINDIVKKIGLLQELIEKTKTPAPSTGLLPRMGGGLIGLPVQPIQPIQPQIPVQPQIPIQPVQPSAPVQPTVDDKQARLQRLIKAAQDRIAGQGGTVPISSPSSTPPSGLQKFSVPKGTITLDVSAPKGWGELYNLYTMYTRATEQQTLNNQLIKGVFHIPLQEYNSLMDSRNQFVAKYNTYLGNLTPAERAYLEDSNNINIHRLHTEMLNNTKLEPAELAKILFKESKIPFKEITEGNAEPMIEMKIDAGGENIFKKDEDKKQYKKYENVYTQSTMDLLNIQTSIKQDPSQQNLKKQANKVERINSNISNAYEFLDGIVKVAVTRENSKFLQRINQSRQQIANLQTQQPLVNPNNPVAPEPLQPVPLDPAEQAGQQAEPKMRLSKARSLLKKYYNKANPSFTNTIQEAVKVALSDLILAKLIATKNNDTRREALKDEIRKAGIV